MQTRFPSSKQAQQIKQGASIANFLTHSHHGNMLGFTHCTSCIAVQPTRAPNTRSLSRTSHVKVCLTRKLSHRRPTSACVKKQHNRFQTSVVTPSHACRPSQACRGCPAPRACPAERRRTQDSEELLRCAHLLQFVELVAGGRARHHIHELVLGLLQRAQVALHHVLRAAAAASALLKRLQCLPCPCRDRRLKEAVRATQTYTPAPHSGSSDCCTAEFLSASWNPQEA
jgi:hypothetical protein